ncbi:DJ-1/PfpI family protein [soil metagenome]
MRRARDVAILLFEDVEVLDFAGPFEVFSVTGQRDGSAPFRVFTTAEAVRPIRARNGLSVNPHCSLEACLPPDILVVPGGFGTRREMNNPVLLDWIRRIAPRAEVVLSVCTGSVVLGRAGLLDGLQATTHHGALDLLAEAAPNTTIRRDLRFVDNGHIITSAGISAGIDASLHVVARLLGVEQARETATHMEYDWRSEPVTAQSSTEPGARGE